MCDAALMDIDVLEFAVVDRPTLAAQIATMRAALPERRVSFTGGFIGPNCPGYCEKKTENRRERPG